MLRFVKVSGGGDADECSPFGGRDMAEIGEPGNLVKPDFPETDGRADGGTAINPMRLDLLALMRAAPRCGARCRDGSPCEAPAVRGQRRCRMHGGARGSGAPRGERNGNYRHGRATVGAQRWRRYLSARVRLLGRMVRLFKPGLVTVELPPHLALEKVLLDIEEARLYEPASGDDD